MFKRIVSYIFFVFFPLYIFSGFKSSSTETTAFYFYKGKPFYLNLKNDLLFVKLRSQLSGSQLEELLLRYDFVNSVEKHSLLDNKLFIKLSESFDQTGLNHVIQMLKLNNEIANVSPVFSPDNGKTLIGVEDEVLVQFKEGISDSDRINFLRSKNCTVEMQLDLSGGKSYLLKVNREDYVLHVANEVFHSGLVNWAEPNLYYTNVLCYLPNDPFVNEQWSILNTGSNIPGNVSGVSDCDMDIDSAWMQGRGSSNVIVAISDTGIDTLHEDISPNLIPGSGYNFIHNIPGAFDDGNHGTAVTGIIAAASDNGIGVSGIAPRCKLFPVKWLNSSGSGNFAGAVNATIYSYQNGAWIINNSWGFTGGASSALDQAITDAVTIGRNGKGTLFIVGAGNENSALRYPANSHLDVISVGSISPCNERKKPSSCDGELWGSNYGNNLHVVVPGVKIYTTDRSGNAGYSSDDYFPYFTGTSSATPHVSGVCALILSIDSTLRWDSVRARITRFSEKRGVYNYTLPGPLGTGQWFHEMGYGLVNANRSIQYTIDQLGPHIDIEFHKDTEDLSGPYNINCIVSPTGSPINPSSVELFWSKDNSKWYSVSMSDLNDSAWTADIPGDGLPGIYKYYVSASDDLNRTITHPFTAPIDFHSFKADYDTIPPEIVHTPIGLMAHAYWPPRVEAKATDYFGIDSVYVLWKVKSNGTINRFELNLNESGNYEGYFGSNPGVISSDTVYYTIFAKDKSVNGNHNFTEQFAITFYERTVVFFDEFKSNLFDTLNWADTFYVDIVDSNGVYLPPFEYEVPSVPYFIKFKYPYSRLISQNINLSTFDIAYLSIFHSQIYTNANHQIKVDYYSGSGEWELLKRFETNGEPYRVPFDSVCIEIPPDGLHSDFKIRFNAVQLNSFNSEFYFDNIMIFGGTFTGVEQVSGEIPLKFSLEQNYPNPFNPVTRIEFKIPKESFVKLRIYDLLGREIVSLINSEYEAGTYSIDFNAVNYPSGVYFYRFEAGDFVQTKRMVLIK